MDCRAGWCAPGKYALVEGLSGGAATVDLCIRPARSTEVSGGVRESLSSELTVVRLELYDGRSGPTLASDVGVSNAGLCVCGGVALMLSDVSKLKPSTPVALSWLPDARRPEPLGLRKSERHGEGDEGWLCEPIPRRWSTLACDVSARAAAGRVAVVVEEGIV